MDRILKLYLVTTAGRLSCHVVADTPNDAKSAFEKWLDKENYGFSDDREVVRIELVAKEGVYPGAGKNKLIVDDPSNGTCKSAVERFEVLKKQ